MLSTVDARGLSCPQPVLLAKAALESGQKTVELMVDDMAACENVAAFAKSKGWQAAQEKQGNYILLRMTR